MNALNRNVTIVVIILILVVIAGYLVWLRSRYQPPVSPIPEQPTASPVASPTTTATPSATPVEEEEEATVSPRQRTSTPSATGR